MCVLRSFITQSLQVLQFRFSTVINHGWRFWIYLWKWRWWDMFHKGDLGPTVSALRECLGGWSHSSSSPWWKHLRWKQWSWPKAPFSGWILYSQCCRAACAKNAASTKELSEDSSQPLNYYAAFAKVILQTLLCRALSPVDMVGWTI